MGSNFESVLEKVGGWGRYQRIAVPLICLMFVPLGFFVFTPVFTYQTPPHRCFINGVDTVAGNATAEINHTVLESYIPYNLSENGKSEFARCSRFVITESTSYWYVNTTTTPVYQQTNTTRTMETCLDGWIYMDSEGRTSATTEYNLVCDDAWKKPLLTSGLMIGLFLGSIISGPITDRFGRRTTCLVNMVLNIVLVIGFSFISSYEALLVMIIAIGTSHIIWYSCTFVLAQELVDRKHRALVACMVNVIYAIGYMLLPAVAYIFKDWRWIIRSLGLGSAIFLPYIFLLPESPRWLASQGRIDEAIKVLKQIAVVNGVNQTVLQDLNTNNMELGENLLEKTKDKNNANKQRERRRSSVQVLAKNSVMRRRSVMICWVWNVTFLCYYALGLNTSNLGGSNYLNCFAAAALEIPCHFLVVVAIQKAGRRSSLTTFLGLAGIFVALSPAFQNFEGVSITFAMLGKFFASSAMGILYLYTSELYPTLLRNTGIGIASMTSRFGSICAPFLVFAGENGRRNIPFYVMAALGISTAGLCLLLPETKQSSLPDTMKDAIDLEKFRLFLSSRKKNRNESQAALTKGDEYDDVIHDFEDEQSKAVEINV
ncbi:solute carrier family 22 member 21-like [Styela clava]